MNNIQTPKIASVDKKPRSTLELVEDYEDAAEASEIIGEAKNRKEKLYSFEEVAKLVGYKRGK